MPAVMHPARPYRTYLGVVLTLFSALVGGCARPPTHEPGKAELLRQIREAYLFDIDVADLELLSVPEIVARLDPDTRLVEVRRRMSPDFIRGFEPEGSVVAMRALSGGRGYLRLAFFGRRTLEDLRKALSISSHHSVLSPLICVTTMVETSSRRSASRSCSCRWARP